MSITALDIGTYTIKAVSGDNKRSVSINKAIETYNETGLNHTENETQSKNLQKIIHSVFHNNNLPTDDIRISLPESIVSTSIIDMPSLTDAELASAIHWQAEQHIPIPKEELNLEYEVLSRPQNNSQNNQMKVLMVGVKKKEIDDFLDIFNNLSMEPTIIESQMPSLLRSLAFENNDPTTLVIHIGASEAMIFVVQQAIPQFVFTFNSGGQLLTNALIKKIGLEAQQAEEYKRTYGLDPNQFEGKIRNALLPAIETITTQINKAFRYYTNHNSGDNIARIVLSGGSAKLPGLVKHLSQMFNTEVLLASPFVGTKGNIPQQNQQSYSICMGLLSRQN